MSRARAHKKTWSQVVDQLERLPEYSVVQVRRRDIEPPARHGLHPSYGEPEGQLQDYRKSLAHERGFHVREYPDHYTAHIDSVDVDKDFFGHVLADSPTYAVLASAAIGAGIAAVTDCQRDALKGALLGATAAVIAMTIRKMKQGQ